MRYILMGLGSQLRVPTPKTTARVPKLNVMSKKSSPPTRSARPAPAGGRRRPRRGGASSAAPAPAADHAPATMKERVRHYLPFVGIPNLVLVLGSVVVCLAVILLSGGRLAALPASIAEVWFVLHGVPLTFEGVTLGAMPLLPPIGVVALIAWRVRVATHKRVSILDLYAIFGLVVLIPFTLSAAAWFMVEDAAAVFPVAPPAIHKALLIPVFVQLVGMACGMSGRLWKALLARIGAPESLFDAAQATVHLSFRLLGAAAVVYLILLAAGYNRLVDLLHQFPVLGIGGGVALFMLSVLYLPNAVVSTLAVLLGAPVGIAQGGISLFDASLVPLPPFPLLAAIPVEVPVWAPVLLAIPAAVMIHFVLSRRLDWIEILVASAFAAVLAVCAGLMAGGDVGAYGWIGPNPWFFALAFALWVAIIAGTAWLMARFTQNPKRVTSDPVPAAGEDTDSDSEADSAGQSDQDNAAAQQSDTGPETEAEPQEDSEDDSEDDPVTDDDAPADDDDDALEDNADEGEETEDEADQPSGSTAISVLREEQLD